MKKKKSSNIPLVLVLILGLSLMLYPSFADYWNSFTQTRVIASYSAQVAELDQESYDQYWFFAREYNQSLVYRENVFTLTEVQKAQYDTLLNLGGGGIMGVIEIPSIGVSLPVYHGTDDAVLQVAVGHLDWTSLPVGGESTHCVISGHRGLPSARLFTDLDQLKVGDYFMMHVLDETLTYEVDQIRIVEPHVVEDLLIQEGQDLLTMVTCTPYGINSHRLLVRGHRVDNLVEPTVVRVTADAMIVEKLVVVPFVLAPILLVMLLFTFLGSGKRKK